MILKVARPVAKTVVGIPLPTDEGYVLELLLPFVKKEAVALSQKGNELTVKVGSCKRNVHLPHKLQGRDALGARLDNCVLTIKFGSQKTASHERCPSVNYPRIHS